MSEKWPQKTIVEVSWLDACVQGKWGRKDDYLKEGPMLCRTAGYLLKKDKSVVIIVQSQSVAGGVADSMTIPRSCVTKIRRLT